MFELLIREITPRRTPQQQLEWRRALEDAFDELADDEIDALVESRKEGIRDVFTVGKIQATGATLYEVAEDVTYRRVHFPAQVLLLMIPGDLIYAGLGRDANGSWEALYVRDWA